MVLPSPGGTGKDHMVKGVTAVPGGLDEYFQIGNDFFLTDEILKPGWAYLLFETGIPVVCIQKGVCHTFSVFGVID